MSKVIAVLGVGLLVGACSGSHPSATSSTGGSGGSSGTGGGTSGTTGTIDLGCGTVSEQGECDANVAKDCYTGDLADGGTAIIAQNCSTTVTNGPALVCGAVSGDYLAYGVACESASANPCAFDDSSGQIVLVPCAGDAGVGCVLQNTMQGSTCEGGFTPCTYFDDGGLPAPYCFTPPGGAATNLLILNCVYDQPTAIDCGTYGGQCANDAGVCENLPSGAFCDSLFVCAGGPAACVQPPDGGLHVCQ